MKPIVSGKVCISFGKRKVFDVFGKTVRLKKEIEFPVMSIDGRTVMSKTPQEVRMMREESKGARGRALVAGLGLGVILEYLARKKCVVHVVEKSQDVIKAYNKYRGGHRQYDFLHQMSIEDFLEKPPNGKFDFVHFDTWFELDPEHLPHINWLIERVKPILHDGAIVRAWGYDHMSEGFVRDCVDMFVKQRRALMRTHPENLKRLMIRFPLLGMFAAWLLGHPDADQQAAVVAARNLAKMVKRAEGPAEYELELNAIKEAHYGSESFFRLMKGLQELKGLQA